MRILTRYVLLDLLKVFTLTLVGMTAFIFLVLIGKAAVENGLGLLPIVRMLPYILPTAMQYTVPGAMLLAAVSVYGRVAASNEIVAIKSLGISPMTMVWPAIILAILVSFGAVVLNDIAVSWGHGGVQRVILEALEEVVYGRLRRTRSYSNKRLKVNVQRVVGKKLIRPTILLYASGDKPVTTITADEAEFHSDVAQNTVMLSMFNAEVEFGSKGSISHPGRLDWLISLEDFAGQHARTGNPANYPLSKIGPSIEQQELLIEQIRQEMAASTAYALCTGRMFELSKVSWQRRQNQLHGAQSRLHRLHAEPYRRWANGFSCLCFVMIGAPMAICRRHGEVWGSFFACFLPILIVYYPMLVGCLDAAKDGALPPQAVWLGNLALALWGAWLMRRVIRF